MIARLAAAFLAAASVACSGATTTTAPSNTPFAGTWSGTYTVIDCQGGGSAQVVICRPPGDGRPGGAFPAGSQLPISLTLTQAGKDVNGMLALGPATGNVAGGVDDAGILTLRGTAVGAPFSAAIVDWNTRLAGGSMDGLAAYSVTMPETPRVGGLMTSVVMTKQ